MARALHKRHLQVFARPHAEWQRLIAHTKFNLAPRGFGRTSFRLAEVVQIGRLPVYLYDDVPWLPYAGTNISVEAFGYSVHALSPAAVDAAAMSLQRDGRNNTELVRRLEVAKQARVHYTYEGVLAQLELFLRNPLGDGDTGGQLRCVRVPGKVV